MPYSRPTLTQLKSQAAQDISSAFPGADPLLRFSNLGLLGRMLAGIANLHYGYLDWIARMCVPFTAAGEWLMAWGALKGVNLKAATLAGSTGGAVTILNCTPGVLVPAGFPIVRGDNLQYTVQTDARVGDDGTIVLNPIAVATGSIGNTLNGQTFTLGASIDGMQTSGLVTTPITGGTDDETMDAYRSRVLEAYANPPQGGAKADYIRWALAVPGVTRAWCYPLGMGAGTVIVRFMMDGNTGSNGFPVGSDGVATDEPRGTTATGDQLAVANYTYGDDTTERQPVTALVYAVAPTPENQDFTIAHIAGVSDATKALISTAIAGVFVSADVEPGGMVDLDDVESAIGAIPGTKGFVITSPTDNITLSAGALPQVGTITYTA